jgi:hypothetical protein
VIVCFAGCEECHEDAECVINPASGLPQCICKWVKDPNIYLNFMNFIGLCQFLYFCNTTNFMSRFMFESSRLLHPVNPLTTEYNATRAFDVVSQHQVYLPSQFTEHRVFRLLIVFRESPPDFSTSRTLR